MTEYARFPWLQTYREKLLLFKNRGKVPHALLITGTAGLGKSELAHYFARALLCNTDNDNGSACGKCSSCRLIRSKSHPDLINIEPEQPGHQITIDRIRELIASVSLNIHYGAARVVIIDQAHRLNLAAGNSLLKTLEEPAKGTVIILVTDMAWMLPRTIISRCQRIDLAVPDQQLAVEWLHEKSVTENVEILLQMAHGAPLRAYALEKQGALEAKKNLYRCLIQLTEKAQDPISAAESIREMDIALLLSLFMSWVCDLVRIHFNPNCNRLANPDYRATLQQEIQKLNLRQLFNFLDQLFEVRKNLFAQLNKLLVLEELFVEWQRLPKNY